MKVERDARLMSHAKSRQQQARTTPPTPVKYKGRQNLSTSWCLPFFNMSLFVSRAQSPEYPWSPTPNASPDLVEDSISLGVEDTPRATPQPVQRFRFRNRYCILTYSQTDGGFDPKGIVDNIHADGGLCVIGRERHADGGTHFHAFVDYVRIRDWTGSSRWDVGGHHPNCNPVSRTPHRAFSYAIKDGDVVHDDFDESTRPKGPIGDRRRGNGASKRNFAEITDAVDKEDFFAKMQKLDPRALVCAFGNVTKFADWKFPDPRRPHEQPSGVCISILAPTLVRGFGERLGKPGR